MFTMKQGRIANNTVTGTDYVGGGVYIDSDEAVSITGVFWRRRGEGSISINKADGGAGIYVGKGRRTMSGGYVTCNEAKGSGGGVYVNEGAEFIQSGGSISNNTARIGGGAAVEKGGAFTQRGGSVKDNKAAQGADIYRE
jgi:hypothetical protein